MQDSSYVTAVVLSRRQPLLPGQVFRADSDGVFGLGVSRHGAEKSLGFLLTCRV